MKFNIDNYDKNYVMHCPTAEAADIFLSHLDSLGKTWCNGIRYTEKTNWSKYESNTCYRFINGTYENLGYKRLEKVILEFYDFDWDDNDFNQEDTSALEQFLKSFQVSS